MSTAEAPAWVAPTVYASDLVQFSRNPDDSQSWQTAFVDGVVEGGQIDLLVLGGLHKGTYECVFHQDDPRLKDPRLGRGRFEDGGGVWRESPQVAWRNALGQQINALQDEIARIEGLHRRIVGQSESIADVRQQLNTLKNHVKEARQALKLKTKDVAEETPVEPPQASEPPTES